MSVNAMPLVAGDPLTANGFNCCKPLYAWKTAAESVTNSATDQLDNELFLPLEPYSTYLVLACYSVSGPSAAGIRIGYSVPTGAQGRRHNIGLAMSVTTTADNVRISVQGWPTPTDYGSNTTPVSIIEEGVLYTETAGGLLHMQWAQSVANATAVTVGASSFLKIQRVL